MLQPAPQQGDALLRTSAVNDTAGLGLFSLLPYPNAIETVNRGAANRLTDAKSKTQNNCTITGGQVT